MVDKKIVSAIHARFRQLRNGEVVDNLIAQGISYGLAWGVESYHLREIAQEIEPSTELAEYLWNEDVRESKMLATRIYPTDQMTMEKATEWITSIIYPEIADQMCMNILAKMPAANDIVAFLANCDIEKETINVYTAMKLATRIETKSVNLINLSKSILNNNAPIYLKTAALWYIQMYEQE